MKTFFLLAILILGGLSLVNWASLPNPRPHGKPVITWVSDDNPVRKGQIALFEQLNPGIDLQLDPNNGGLEKVIVQSLAGVGPDVFDAYDPSHLEAYVRSGIALDVTDELKRLGIDIERDIFPALRPFCILNGRVYGVPTNLATNGIWFNKAIFEAEKVDFPTGPWRWPEFVQLAQRMTQRDERGRVRRWGFLWESYNWAHFAFTFGGSMYSDDGTRCTVDEPGGVAATQFMYDLIYKYRVSPSPVDEQAMAQAGGWGAGAIKQFAGGAGAMALGGRWWLCTLRSEKGLRLGVAETPIGSHRVHAAYGRSSLVNARSRNVGLALKWLAYLASPEYNRLINEQADGVSAFAEHVNEPGFRFNPKYPDETNNAMWAASARYGKANMISPFVNPTVANRIFNNQLDLVRANAKQPAQAMHDAARLIHEEMAKSLKESPELRAQFEAARAEAKEQS